ncbi:hypothetical protein Acsp01_13580 [Actinoplanes sp. NBRC 101535]|nr:hypothetical protein Acsp01_13580 [Actinoplanes sp. NBRC 101535]
MITAATITLGDDAGLTYCSGGMDSKIPQKFTVQVARCGPDRHANTDMWAWTRMSGAAKLWGTDHDDTATVRPQAGNER